MCSPDYPFKKKPKRIEDLFGERILIREDGSGTREVLERYLESCNLSIGNFRQTVEIGSMHTIKELTKLKCGITFLYDTAIWEELESEALVKIPLEDFHIVREFTFIWRRGSFYADKYREKFGYFSKRRKSEKLLSIHQFSAQNIIFTAQSRRKNKKRNKEEK